MRLVEQSWQKGDPDPKALACYGVLWQEGPPDDPHARPDVVALCHWTSGQRHHHPVSRLVLRAAGKLKAKTLLVADLG